jgi:hypothetical protein
MTPHVPPTNEELERFIILQHSHVEVSWPTVVWLAGEILRLRGVCLRESDTIATVLLSSVLRRNPGDGDPYDLTFPLGELMTAKARLMAAAEGRE